MPPDSGSESRARQFRAHHPTGTEVQSQTLLDGMVKYRLVHLTFGPDEKLGLDIGIFTPIEGGPFPAVIMPAGTPPGATPLPRQPQGPGQGRGVNALLAVGPDAIWPFCFEGQLKNGNAGQVVGMGLDIPAAPLLNNRKRAPRLAEPSEKSLGEGNSSEITYHDDTIEVFVNGVRQNFVENLPVTRGAIALQMEGYPIEFRNVWLEPL
ncbi:MAG TPA: family 16 glycoside hydrolase [Opitutaceae bacterium]